MSSDTVQVTLNRTQVALLRQLLTDANTENMRAVGKEMTAPYSSEAWKEANANYYRKRAQTARWLRMKLAKAKDMRRKYIDLSTELFPMSN